MFKGVIFDLDQTLVNSQSLATLRSNRAWQSVYKRLREIDVFDGMVDLLALLVTHKVPLAIVTSSPRSYCTKVVKAVKFPITEFVCYHDTAQRKPHPEPMYKALTMLKLKPNEAIAIGDDLKDIQSANAAQIYNIACTWGTADATALAAGGANLICHSVDDLRQELEEKLGISL
jgi:HAD superfamily hydrolase (TIGR01662 family)